MTGDRARKLPRDRIAEERHTAGPWEVVVERPASADELIDEQAFAQDELLPYWAELWPSAVALAGHVSALPLAGARVLEVGCGVGLPSIVAALAGADVLATDWAPEALAYAERNAARNGAIVATAILRWDSPDVLAGQPPFDLVLGADVLYEERNVAPLLELFALVAAQPGDVLLADPGRRHADGFLAAAGRAGWRTETLPATGLPRGGIHRLWRDRP